MWGQCNRQPVVPKSAGRSGSCPSTAGACVGGIPGVARRYKLDEAKKREIVAILTVGGKRVTAADYVGCSISTIARTAERDAEFADALRAAKSRHEIVNLQNIQDAGKKSWRASSWLLERSFPTRYGKRAPKTMTPEEFGYLVTQFAKIVADEVSAVEDRARVLSKLDALAEKLCRNKRPQPTPAVKKRSSRRKAT